jgi:hypothetical protein
MVACGIQLVRQKRGLLGSASFPTRFLPFLVYLLHFFFTCTFFRVCVVHSTSPAILSLREFTCLSAGRLRRGVKLVLPRSKHPAPQHLNLAIVPSLQVPNKMVETACLASFGITPCDFDLISDISLIFPPISDRLPDIMPGRFLVCWRYHVLPHPPFRCPVMVV